MVKWVLWVGRKLEDVMLKIEKTPGNTDWFVHDRFGMFIHWGLYSLAARHEWVRNNEEIPEGVYDERYFSRFDPDLYDPERWAAAAADAGMKYVVVTTKHHEGFCLWDSKFTEYKATRTPAGRDLLRPLVEAVKGKGMKMGFYYSLLDWHHPDYVIDPHIGPSRNAKNMAELNVGREQKRYAEYMYNQTRELLTEFGKVDVLWYDFSYPRADGLGKGREEWQSEKLYKLVRELMPEVILDDRLDLPSGWDVKTPEQYQPREWVRVGGKPVVWEACQTFSGSWGYHRDEHSWKSVEQLVGMLIDTVSKGGNLLLNVGPTGRGEFDARALARLEGMGEWMRRHGRSIYGCTQAPEEFVAPGDCRLTYNPATRRVYVHVLAWPCSHLHLDGFGGKVAYAQLLNDASEIKMIEQNPSGGVLNPTGAAWNIDQVVSQNGGRNTLTLTLPVAKPNVTVPVIEMFLK